MSRGTYVIIARYLVLCKMETITCTAFFQCSLTINFAHRVRSWLRYILTLNGHYSFGRFNSEGLCLVWSRNWTFEFFYINFTSRRFRVCRTHVIQYEIQTHRCSRRFQEERQRHVLREITPSDRGTHHAHRTHGSASSHSRASKMAGLLETQ